VIPVSDTPRTRIFPYVNVGIIALNFLVFFYELSLSERELNRFFFDYGVVPRHLTDWLENPSGLEEPLTIVTSAFIHGGWLHLLGNMAFLWVFGDNIEDALGHVKYVLFYFLSATGAVFAQVAIDTDQLIPMVGASGAIAGVLGAYIVFYPKATIGTLVGYLFYTPLPAALLIGFWFVMQLFSGVASLGSEAIEEGVAFWAHVGGFVTGFALALAVRPFVRLRPMAPLRRRRRSDMW
jgi:membrane associated rhomboid family serine protease